MTAAVCSRKSGVHVFPGHLLWTVVVDHSQLAQSLSMLSVLAQHESLPLLTFSITEI